MLISLVHVYFNLMDMIVSEEDLVHTSELYKDTQHHTGAGGQLKQYTCILLHLNLKEHQPSGTCNFSRIDNAVLNVEHQT